MDRLPVELVAHVAVYIADIAQVERWLSCSRDMHTLTHDDGLYRYVAVAWWGEPFWRRAPSRLTVRRTFRSMREELRIMYVFNRANARRGEPMWVTKDYLHWWWHEEQYVRTQRAVRGRRRAHTYVA